MADESAANRSARHATQALVYGAPVASETLVDSLEAVTAADMLRFGKELLEDGRTASAVLGPKSAIKAAKAFASTIKSHSS
jgi:predicted Zn-dependent peptidase